jgi:hypothetical protein
MTVNRLPKILLTHAGHPTHDEGMAQEQASANAIPEWTLGWRLKRALTHGKVSVQEMADHLDYSRGQLSRYLNDKGEPPRRSVLRMWALRCGVPFDWLAYGIESDDPDDPAEQVSKTSP